MMILKSFLILSSKAQSIISKSVTVRLNSTNTYSKFLYFLSRLSKALSTFSFIQILVFVSVSKVFLNVILRLIFSF